jgi:hypothetical protein
VADLSALRELVACNFHLTEYQPQNP